MERSSALTRRRFLGYLGGITGGTIALGLAACGGAATGGKPTAPPTNSASSDLPDWLAQQAKPFKGRTVSVVASQQYFATANQDFVTACNKFGELTGTTVQVSTINVDTGNLVTRQDAAVKARNVQDMAFVDSSRFVSQLQQLGDLEPVTDVVKELEGKYGAAHDVNRIYLTKGNDWYGIPFFSLVNGAFARKDWLQEKGIKTSDFITHPKTYVQMRDIALEISDPSQQRYGWGITYNGSGDGNGFILGVLNAYGAAVASNDGTKVVFGSGPETEEAVRFISDTYSNPKYSKMIPPGVQSWTDPSNNQAWLAGLIGFTFNAYSLYAQSRAQNNPVYDKTLTFGGLLGPAITEVLDIPASESFVIFKSAKEPGLAKVLAKYLVYGSPLLSMVKDSTGLILPAYTNIWNSNSYYLNGDQAFKSQHQVLVQPLPIKAKTGLSFPQAPSPGGQAVNTAYPLSDMIGQIVTKKASVKDAIATCKQRIIQIFEQQGLPQR